jgi:hypothetical protein
VDPDTEHWEIQSVKLVFWTGFVNHCPSNLLPG